LQTDERALAVLHHVVGRLSRRIVAGLRSIDGGYVLGTPLRGNAAGPATR